jgi:hypothetical protein
MFDGAHIHLLTNHIPILGPLFVLPLLIAGVVKKNRSITIAALVMAVAVAVATIPAFVTGEEAEEAVEGMMGVSEVNIEEHEEEAEIAYYAMLMAGAVALGALLSSTGGRSVSPVLSWLTTGILVATFILMARTGNSGGKIRHTELDRTVSAAPAQGQDNDD